MRINKTIRPTGNKSERQWWLVGGEKWAASASERKVPVGKKLQPVSLNYDWWFYYHDLLVRLTSARPLLPANEFPQRKNARGSRGFFRRRRQNEKVAGDKFRSANASLRFCCRRCCCCCMVINHKAINSVLLARAPANQINHFEWNKNREKAGGAPRSRWHNCSKKCKILQLQGRTASPFRIIYGLLLQRRSPLRRSMVRRQVWFIILSQSKILKPREIFYMRTRWNSICILNLHMIML